MCGVYKIIIREHHLKYQDNHKVIAPVILLVNAADYKSEKAVEEIINSHCTMYKVKARNLTKQKLDMVVQVHTKKGMELLEELMAVESVVSASLLDYDGEVTF